MAGVFLAALRVFLDVREGLGLTSALLEGQRLDLARPVAIGARIFFPVGRIEVEAFPLSGPATVRAND